MQTGREKKQGVLLRPIIATFHLLATSVVLCCSTTMAVADASLLWEHDCDTLEGLSSSTNTSISLDQAPTNIKQGSASVRAELPREPGMKDGDWHGWYKHGWHVPDIDLTDDARLQFWFKMDRVEPYYPVVRVRLRDDKEQMVYLNWNPPGGGEARVESANRWLWVDIPIDEEHIRRREGGEPFGAVNLIEVFYNYDSFRQFETYTRWYDNVRVVSGSAGPEALADEKPLLPNQSEAGEVREIDPSFPALFAPYQADPAPPLPENGTWLGRPAMAEVDQQRHVPHSRYGAWRGPDDQSADLWVSWNPDGLRVATEVTDDAVRTNDVGGFDYKDSDHFRIYLDAGRQAVMNTISFDADDHVFAAVADSPDGGAHMQSVTWPGMWKTPPKIDDELLKVYGEVGAQRWRVTMEIPPRAAPALDLEPNAVMTFGCIWGDTDVKERKNELTWPSVRHASTNDYWRQLDLYGDLVLMSPEGGFTFRLLKNNIARGETLMLDLAGVHLAAPKTLETIITLRNASGEELESWQIPVTLRSQSTWHRLRLPTRQVPPGDHFVTVNMAAGQANWSVATPWPLQVVQRSAKQWLAELQQNVRELTQFRKQGRARLRELRHEGYPVDYPMASIALIDLFFPELEQAVEDRELVQAQRTADVLMKAMADAKREMADPSRYLAEWRRMPQNLRPLPDSVVDFSTDRYLVDGKPIFLIGMTSRWSWKLDIVGRLGFNAFHVNDPMKFVLEEAPDADAMSQAYREQMRVRNETMIKEGVWPGPIGITAGSPAPAWLVADKEDMARSSGHFIPYSLESERMKDVLARYYRLVIGEWNKYPPMTSFVILNEPSYIGRTPAFADMFRNRLRIQYADIAALNSEWQTDYESFDNVSADRLMASVAGRRDWADFNRRHLTRHTRYLQGLLEKYRRRPHPGFVKFMPDPVKNPNAWAEGCDWEAVTQFMDLTGYDSNNVTEPMITDYFWSIGGDKPLVNGEVHFDWHPDAAPWAEQWRLVAHGVDLLVYWEWRRPYRLAKKRGYPTLEPYSLYRTARETLDQHRLVEELADLSAQPRRVAILHTLDALTLDTQPFLKAVQDSYDALQWMQTPIRFITERQVARGDLTPDDIDILIIPAVKHIDAKTVKLIDRYLERGGAIVAVGDVLENDTAGRPLSNAMSNWPANDRLYRIDPTAADWQDDVDRYQWFEQHLSQADVHRPIRLLKDDGNAPYGVEVTASNELGLAFVMPVAASSDGLEVTLTRESKPVSGFDLITHTNIGPTIKLEQHRAILIRLDEVHEQ